MLRQQLLKEILNNLPLAPCPMLNNFSLNGSASPKYSVDQSKQLRQRKACFKLSTLDGSAEENLKNVYILELLHFSHFYHVSLV